MVTDQEKDLWVTLANLFFLDTESQESDFDHTALLLKYAGWSREQTKNFLIQFVAPIAGANLGYLIFPVTTGHWAGFDKEPYCLQIQKLIDRRPKCPAWFFFFSDKFYCRMIKKLNADHLLNKL